MTPEVQQYRPNMADALRELSGPDAIIPDLSSTIKRVESVNTVRFVFHPWLPINNLGADGFALNVHYLVLDRLKLIPITVFDYTRIINKRSGFSLMSSIVGDIGGIPGRGQVELETVMQMPATSIDYLRTAHGAKGLVELESLISANPEELHYSYGLYHSIFREAQNDEDLKRGHRPPGLVLEDFPRWLDKDASRLLFDMQGENVEKGAKLISEIRKSIDLAFEAALSPSVGILPKTKEGLNITANRGTGGKTHLDAQDEWLLKQFPSFEMDTDVERARMAMQTAIEAGNAGQQNVTKVMVELMAQQQAAMAQQQQTLDLLTQAVLGSKAKPSKTTAPE